VWPFDRERGIERAAQHRQLDRAFTIGTDPSEFEALERSEPAGRGDEVAGSQSSDCSASVASTRCRAASACFGREISGWTRAITPDELRAVTESSE
jgi:hypothetical protein